MRFEVAGNADIFRFRFGAVERIRFKEENTGGGFLIAGESSGDHSAPGGTGCILYLLDNGGGKTKLMALFPSGAAQQIALEP